MPKRKRPEEDPKKQFERFVETAREHGVTEEEAERNFRRVADSKKPPRKPHTSDSDKSS
jgi:hypothetical protein